MTSYSTKESFEFSVTGAEADKTGPANQKIQRVKLHTDDVPQGYVSVKPRKKVEKSGESEHGIPENEEDEVPMTWDEIQENHPDLLQIAIDAQDEYLTVRGTVTGRTEEGEEPSHFVNWYNVDELQRTDNVVLGSESDE